jgi:hypothetical protein
MLFGCAYEVGVGFGVELATKDAQTIGNVQLQMRKHGKFI